MPRKVIALNLNRGGYLISKVKGGFEERAPAFS